MRNNIKRFGGGFDLARREERVKIIEAQISAPDAWNDQAKITPLLKEKRCLEEEIGEYKKLERAYTDMQEWLVFADEGEEEALSSLNEQAEYLHAFLEKMEMAILLADETDHMDAIVDIHRELAERKPKIGQPCLSACISALLI